MMMDPGAFNLTDLIAYQDGAIVSRQLAKAAGGLGLCQGTVFADTKDPDYLAILSAIETTSRRHTEEKRFEFGRSFQMNQSGVGDLGAS